MDSERILAIDLSSKTGWALVISSDLGIKVRDYGTIPQIHQPDGDYPSNYILWAYDIFEKILNLIKVFNPEVLVIEETSKGSKNAMSQKILEFSHFLLGKYIMDSGIKSIYMMTEEWRREIGCKMNTNEKLKNKEVRAFKKSFERKNGKKTAMAYDINGKRIGIISRKHVNIRRVSEIFEGQLREPLKRKDEDLADGLGLAAAYHFRRINVKNNLEELISLEDLIKIDNK